MKSRIINLIAALAIVTCVISTASHNADMKLPTTARHAGVGTKPPGNTLLCDFAIIKGLRCLVCTGSSGGSQGGPIFTIDCDWRAQSTEKQTP